MDQDWKSLEAKPAIKVGDLVRKTADTELGGYRGDVGLVLRIDVNMWGEEMVPSGVEVLWGKENEASVEYSDEVELV
jgi:hypothetical protein